MVAMDDQDTWIEKRLMAAVRTATTASHQFPDAVSDELRKLLADQFQEARKPAELDAIAIALISSNRGPK